MAINFTNIKKAYGSHIVFENFNLSIEEGNITCILGSSGCGKTTLLNMISNITAYEGLIEGYGKDVSYIFQKERLLQNLNVYNNIDYVLKSKITDKQKRQSLIFDVLNTVELKDKLKSYPKTLSGGMQQRVSMARAFAYPSNLLLMDEPFKSLDIALKNRLIDAFLKLWEKDKRTILFVTHDIDEAILTANRIIVLEKSPAKVVFDEMIDIPQRLRNFDDKHIANIKNRIYKFMSK